MQKLKTFSSFAENASRIIDKLLRKNSLIYFLSLFYLLVYTRGLPDSARQMRDDFSSELSWKKRNEFPNDQAGPQKKEHEKHYSLVHADKTR